MNIKPGTGIKIANYALGFFVGNSDKDGFVNVEIYGKSGIHTVPAEWVKVA